MSRPSDQTARLARLEALLLSLATGPGGQVRLLTVDVVARFLDVEPNWVYERVDQLGGWRLGAGKSAPIRFDPATLAERVLALETAEPADGLKRPPVRRRARSSSQRPPDDLLPIRGRAPAVPAEKRAA